MSILNFRLNIMLLSKDPEQVEILRQRLMRYFKYREISVLALARELDISIFMLNRFLIKGINTMRWSTFHKIANFLEDKDCD